MLLPQITQNILNGEQERQKCRLPGIRPRITHARQEYGNMPNVVPNRREAGETGSAERHWLYLLRGFGDGRGGENPGKSTILSYFSRMVYDSIHPQNSMQLISRIIVKR